MSNVLCVHIFLLCLPIPANTQSKPTRYVKDIAFKQREATSRNKQKATESVPVINLDAATTPPPDPQSSQWVSNLTVRDEKVLLSGEWLTDSLVNAGQRLIQQAHPHVQGLQDVSLGHTLVFNVIKGEFVQVLHTDAGG